MPGGADTGPKPKGSLWDVLLWAVGEHRVGNRPNRYEPRAVNRRPKNFPYLTVPRTIARQHMRSNG